MQSDIPSFLYKLLGADMADSALDYCVPAVDYDALRKDISSSFEDKVVEIQSLVLKLQKTQRAAEQVLDRCTSPYRCDMRARHGRPNPWNIVSRYEKMCAA